MKRWVLVNLCLTSRTVHLEMLHSYTAVSITRGFRRTFALRGIPCIIWIDACLNIVISWKDLAQSEVKIVLELNIKFAAEELHTWLNIIREKVKNWPLILGAPQGISITPNHVLLGFRNTHGEEINLDVPVQHQLIRWKTCLSIFYSLWIQEFTRGWFNVVWLKMKSNHIRRRIISPPCLFFTLII